MNNEAAVEVPRLPTRAMIVAMLNCTSSYTTKGGANRLIGTKLIFSCITSVTIHI